MANIVYFWIIVGVAGLVLAFRLGRDHEAAEAPLRAQAAQLEDEIQGALALLCADFVYKGHASLNAPKLLASFEPRYPGISKRWQALSDEERIDIGEAALVRLADPEVRAGFETAEAEAKEALKEVKSILSGTG